MHYYVVSYVKRKYYGQNYISDAYKIYCEYSGIIPEIGWNFDFWLNQLFNGKEFHVLDENRNEILDQYLVSQEYISDKDTSTYYQITFNEEE